MATVKDRTEGATTGPEAGPAAVPAAGPERRPAGGPARRAEQSPAGERSQPGPSPPAGEPSPPGEPSQDARKERSRARPFEGSYPMTLTTAILGLSPFIVALTSFYFVFRSLGTALGASATALNLAASLATAGYCFGALVGGDLIQRFPQRPLFLFCEGLFAAGAAMGAAAPRALVLGAGSMLMGFATGLLLVVALPPVFQRFPAERLRYTTIFVNLGFFGALTVGPLLGGLAASGQNWRFIYGGVAGVAVLNIVLALLTLPRTPALNPAVRFDRPAIVLALLGTFLTFWAAAEALGPGFSSALFIVPLALGGICLVSMLVVEYFKKEPLSPVRPLTTTIPTTGILISMTAGGAQFAFLLLLAQFLMMVQHVSPLSAGLAFWPEVVGVLVTAGLVGALLRTKLVLAVPFAGIVLLVVAGGLMLLLREDSGRGLVLAVNALLGLGAGSTVAPGLFMTAWSVPVKTIGRTFALVELIRSEADFILAPVILQIGLVLSHGSTLAFPGFHGATWVALVLAAVSVVLVAGIFLAGGGRFRRGVFAEWLRGERTALVSPPLGAALRRKPQRTGERTGEE